MRDSTSLRVDSLRKQMPGFTLQGSFEVGSSERLAIVGPSGIGKTTLLRLIAGLEKLDRPGDGGRILLAGRDLAAMPVHKRGIGFVFQDQALFSGRSVAQNIGFGLEMRGTPAVERRRRVAEWAARIGLGGREGAQVDVLSGGERQRVALARALISKPRLILLDEPFVGLDSVLRDELCKQILQLHEENPVPLLFVSHDEGDCESLATARLEIRETEKGVRHLFAG